MKRLIVILVILLFLGGGGAAAYIVLMGGDAEADEEMAEAPEETRVLPVFVEFNPIVLPILGDGEIVQFVSIVVTLEVGSEDEADRVVAFAPRLNDAYMNALYGRLLASEVMNDGVVDLRRIKSRLIEESNHVLGPGTVRDALIQMVSQRIL